ncbi:ParB-like protein [Methylocystis sp. B8]|uniref:ParB-like protein n=1 Tax=Methylocystis sp. B8 TaxID=544938 RepID=UPI0010FEFFFF|nr:ParB-like protein [Methylocystis sp. B8]TLG77807.1 chromosome partitioning protein ParB [Methylocystis sp. B8]
MHTARKTRTVRLAELQPTQRAVGYGEVRDKRSKWRALSAEVKRDFLASHPFPAIYGPGAKYFIVDGHHLAFALLQEGVDEVSICQIEDLSDLDASRFFLALQERGLICPSGAPQTLSELPRALQDLADDPFRTLTASLRRDCGCPKDQAPFAEFRWADFLRAHLRLDSQRSEPALAIAGAKRLIRDAWCKDPCAKCRCREEAVS